MKQINYTMIYQANIKVLFKSKKIYLISSAKAIFLYTNNVVLVNLNFYFLIFFFVINICRDGMGNQFWNPSSQIQVFILTIFWSF